MVRIGILGTAAIARPFFGAPLRHASIVAIASRNASQAAVFAREFGIPSHFGSYDALLADPAIDAVYVPLPPALHAEWTIRAARAGKHVLLEKPAAPSSADVERMMEACAAAGVLYMEGFMYRFKSIHRHVRELVTGGTLGPLRFIDFSWCFNIEALKRSLFRLDPSHGGGALNDLGIYGVDFLRYLGMPVPTVVHATIERHGGDGVDSFAHVVLRSGATLMALTAGFTCDANFYTLGGEGVGVRVGVPCRTRRSECIADASFRERSAFGRSVPCRESVRRGDGSFRPMHRTADAAGKQRGGEPVEYQSAGRDKAGGGVPVGPSGAGSCRPPS